MDRGALDLVQGMSGGNQDLLRGAAPVRAGTAEIPRFDHRNGHAGAPRRTGHADAGVASTEDHHIEFLSRHDPTSFVARDDVSRA